MRVHREKASKHLHEVLNTMMTLKRQTSPGRQSMQSNQRKSFHTERSNIYMAFQTSDEDTNSSDEGDGEIF